MKERREKGNLLQANKKLTRKEMVTYQTRFKRSAALDNKRETQVEVRLRKDRRGD